MYKHTILRMFSQISLLLAVLGLAACSGDDLSGSESVSDNDSITNPGVIAQKNFSILAENVQPKIFDPVKGAVDTSLSITVKIGDRNNQLLTDEHKVFFATEWGLIEPFCTTVNGTCSITWQTSFGIEDGDTTVPVDHLTTIVAYTLGEENFTDTNGNGRFDNSESDFDDRVEPYIDANKLDGAFNPAAGDSMIDVMSGNDLGANLAHDKGDGFLNNTACDNDILCSTVRSTIYIWTDIVLDMDGPPAP